MIIQKEWGLLMERRDFDPDFTSAEIEGDEICFILDFLQQFKVIRSVSERSDQVIFFF